MQPKLRTTEVEKVLAHHILKNLANLEQVYGDGMGEGWREVK